VLRSEIAIDFGEFDGAWNTLVRVNPRLVKQGNGN
jgi:hypothetical protein